MGHFYRYQFAFTAVASVGADLALWELHQTLNSTSKIINVWDFQLTLANGTAGAGNLAVRLQREATLIHTAGTDHTARIAKCSSGAPTSGATVRGAGPLTSAGATTTGRLASFGISTNGAGVSQQFRLGYERTIDGLYMPICTLTSTPTTTEQLALVTDAAIPAGVACAIFGSVLWEEAIQ